LTTNAPLQDERAFVSPEVLLCRTDAWCIKCDDAGITRDECTALAISSNPRHYSPVSPPSVSSSLKS
jgi:hypothetical protein